MEVTQEPPGQQQSRNDIPEQTLAVLARAGCQVPTASAQPFADKAKVWGATPLPAGGLQQDTPEPQKSPTPTKSRCHPHCGSAVMALLLGSHGLLHQRSGPWQEITPAGYARQWASVFVVSEPSCAPRCPAWAWLSRGCDPGRAGLGCMAGELPAPGSQAAGTFWSLLFAVEPPWHFREGTPGEGLTAAGTRGTQGLEIARGGLQKATALLEEVWALFVPAQCKAAELFQSYCSTPGETSPSTFPHSPLSQSSNSFVPTAEVTLAKLKMVLGQL